MEIIDTYLPMDRRHAVARGEQLPDRTTGAALFADISGFTRFNTALYQELGPQLGAEELNLQLNHVYGALIAVVHCYGGSVINFGGDAITCWFEKDNGRRATASALDMQKVLSELEVLSTPTGKHYPIGIKVAVTSGNARRFLVGQPRIQCIEILAGEILDRMAAAEKQLHSGEVVVGSEVMGRLGNQAIVSEWRKDENDEYYAVVTGLTEPIQDQAWAELPGLDPEVARDWLLSSVYERLVLGEGEFLAELRPIVATFIKFEGINYDKDDEAGAQLDAYIGWVQRILARYEGLLLNVSIGDKGSYIFAGFGARITHEDDVDRALSASAELITPPDELSIIRDTQIGITRGQVYVGAYGSPTRRTYGANGNDINLAARLMSMADSSQILASRRIVKEASSRYTFEELDPLPIKGFDGPFRLYALTSTSLVMTTDILGHSIYPIVGRDAETSILNDAVEDTLAGRGNSVVIEGEAGIGKTRLVEYILRAARSSGLSTLIGAGDEIGKSSLYYAWRPVFKKLFDLEHISEEGEKSEREQRCSTILNKFSEFAPQMTHLAPLLNEILSSDIPENELTQQMTAEVRADNIRVVLLELLIQAAKSTPIMVVIEDAHWLDSASWAMVQIVSQEALPIQLVIANRPITDPQPSEFIDLLEASQTRHVQLDIFSRPEVEALIRQRLEVDHLPESVLNFVYEKAEGNPFFSEELAYALRDSKLIQIKDNECLITAGTDDLHTLNFPDTSQDVIRSRIDRLTPQEQLVLKVASVIGRTFHYHTLYDVHPVEIDKPHLNDYLDNLESLALTRLVFPEPDLEYMFKHIITQEVAYNLMLFTQRRELHRSIARWYERTYEEDTAQVYSLLAHHWNQTDNSIKAVEFLEKAGRQAVRNFANREAITFLSTALSRIDNPGMEMDDERRAQMELLLGEAHVNLTEYAEGRQHIEKGLMLLGKPIPEGRLKQYGGVLGQVITQVSHRIWPSHYVGRHADQREILLAASRACERLVEVYYITNEVALSLYTAFRTLNLAEDAGPSPELARGYATVGAMVGFIPLHGNATAYLHRALDIVDRVDDLNARTWVDIVVAYYYAGVGNWSEATRLLEDALAISERLGDQRRREDILGNLSAVNFFQGNFDSSSCFADDLIRIARRRNAEHSHAFGLQGKAFALLHMGQFEAAMSGLQELQSLMTDDSKITDEALMLEMYGLLSAAYLRQGKYQQALDKAEQALALSANATPSNYSSYTGYTGPAYVYLSMLEDGQALKNGDKGAAKALKTLRKFARVFPIGEPRRWLYEGWNRWLSGKHSSAQKAWDRSLASAVELDMRYDQGLAHFEIGRHLPGGDQARQENLKQAADIFKQTGAGYDLDRTQKLLSGS